MTFIDERALLETVRQGNKESLTVLLMSPRLYKTATMVKILSSKHLADPACAELLLRNLKFWKTVRIPVQAAIKHDHPDVAYKIVESGKAEITDADLLLAVKRDYNKFCALVLADSKILVQDEVLKKMLHIAELQGNNELIKTILDSPRIDKLS